MGNEKAGAAVMGWCGEEVSVEGNGRHGSWGVGGLDSSSAPLLTRYLVHVDEGHSGPVSTDFCRASTRGSMQLEF